MQKIVNYTLINAYFHELDNTINALLKDGWQPYGSPMLNDKGTFYQAMVKYEE